MDTNIEFDVYFKSKIDGVQKLYYNYMGICKKEYPKWPGWKVIQECRDKGINIKNKDHALLNLLVRNFYFTQYLHDKYIKESI